MAIDQELVKKEAENNFRLGLNCGECVIKSLMDHSDLPLTAEALKMSTGFGGGIGLYGSVCGALAAAVMAVSSVHGRQDPLALPTMEARIDQLYGEKGLYKIFNNLAFEFESEWGGTTCAALTAEFDFNSRDRARNCKKIIGAAAALAAKWAEFDYTEPLEIKKHV